ncbi:AlpA family transcriptional regulator [Acuticoccus sp. I52.16.1]|uniref:helix-turn-helix transcriptional regulator n=1 Tax=Acuticoccus sp. I52.16.1 TaxID=2928472 RepID=UPI001FD18B0C|nr:helix-turn-helix domain-containing protein [Acuticoccus sp. I52.16.1]UOM34870.1 helix-turn-helix domain-containing protein [Acuticoccus sp. I52.16.1]
MKASRLYEVMTMKNTEDTNGSREVEPAYFTVDEAGRYTRTSRQFLDKLRHTGGGPEYLRLSPRAIRYEKAALDAWMQARRCSAVADYREVA